MTSDARASRSGRSAGLTLLTLAILASHAWGLLRVLPTIPGPQSPSRSPSSDVLLGALPLPGAADRLDAIARELPDGPGVVVAHAPVHEATSAYMVIATRLWPRPVSLVACEPAPVLEQFRVPHAVAPLAWRIDLRPGSPTPLAARAEAQAEVSPAALCGTRSR